MKYETIGGKVVDTESNKTMLMNLRIGDRFKSKAGKDVFEVWDEKCKWNGRAGSSTRKCKNLTTGAFELKLCRIEVIKL